MKAFVIGMIFGVLVLFPSMAVHANQCTFSSSGTSNDTCWNISAQFNCDDGTNCSISYGACDWGNDVTAVWFSGQCV